MSKCKKDCPLRPCASPKDLEFIKSCKPPPPPGNADDWELQFCRWWGWNWVKKSDLKKDGQQKPKPDKKPFKTFCNCLCFKKRPKKACPSLQNLYCTPSNSVVLRETYTCGYLEKDGESISCMEVQRNYSRRGRRRVEKGNAIDVRQKMEESSSCSCPDEVTSTESSQKSGNSNYSECCRSFEKATLFPKEKEEPSPRKVDAQLQTLEKSVDIGCCQTSRKLCSNEESKTRTKKKHYKLVCCHHCCCCCCCCGKNKPKGSNPKENAIDEDYPEPPEMKTNFSLDGAKKNPPCNDCVVTARAQHTNQDLQPLGIEDTWLPNNNYFLGEYKPWDRLLYGQKSFSKFGVPSKKYPWLQTTRSDILDKYYTNNRSREFFSPVSGKTFNLAPLRIDSMGGITSSSLPDPLEVEDDIKYLNHLEEQIKVDLESRVMLDAVCDAILYDKKVQEEPSVFLDKFDYTEEANYAHACSFPPPREPPAPQCPGGNFQSCLEASNEFVGSAFRMDSPFRGSCNPAAPQNCAQASEQAILSEIRDLLKKLYVTRSSKEVERSGLDLNSKSDQSSDLPATLEEATKVSNKRTASPTPTEPMKRMKRIKGIPSSGESLARNVNNLFEKIDEIASKGLVNAERMQHVIRGSINRGEDRGRQQKELVEEVIGKNNPVDHLNPSEIFHKIDEIIMRSKHNSDDIQNVLKTIPKKLETGRDYVSSAYICRPLTDENRGEQCPFQLDIISELADENYGEGEVVKVGSTSKKKDEQRTERCATKKKKIKQSLIPVKQSVAVKRK